MLASAGYDADLRLITSIADSAPSALGISGKVHADTGLSEALSRFTPTTRAPDGEL
jgi:hypothetical protein